MALNRRRGLAVVETAIMLPLILMLTMGVLEYGWMFLKAQHVASAAQAGARVAGRYNATRQDIVNAVNEALSAASMSEATSGIALSYSVLPIDGGPGVFGMGDSTGSGGGSEPERLITVTVQVLYADVGLGLPLVPTPEHLRGSVTVLQERP